MLAGLIGSGRSEKTASAATTASPLLYEHEPIAILTNFLKFVHEVHPGELPNLSSNSVTAMDLKDSITKENDFLKATVLTCLRFWTATS